MAAGRRLMPRTNEHPAGTTRPMVLNPDGRRMRLIVASAGNQLMVYTNPDTPLGSVLAAVDSPTGAPGLVLRVEDYGLALMGTLYINEPSGADWNGCVTELLADYELDRAIQKAVG